MSNKDNGLYVLVFIDDDSGDFDAQVFTDHGDACKAMEISYKQMFSDLKDAEEDLNDDECYIEGNCAGLVTCFDVHYQWIITKTFAQTPKMAVTCRQYDKMLRKAGQGASHQRIQRSKPFRCPVSDADLRACYNEDKGIIYFAACRVSFTDEEEYIPYEAYKWCVDRGVQKVSGMDKANRILAEIDANASFDG